MGNNTPKSAPEEDDWQDPNLTQTEVIKNEMQEPKTEKIHPPSSLHLSCLNPIFKVFQHTGDDFKGNNEEVHSILDVHFGGQINWGGGEYDIILASRSGPVNLTHLSVRGASVKSVVVFVSEENPKPSALMTSVLSTCKTTSDFYKKMTPEMLGDIPGFVGFYDMNMHEGQTDIEVPTHLRNKKIKYVFIRMNPTTNSWGKEEIEANGITLMGIESDRYPEEKDEKVNNIPFIERVIASESFPNDTHQEELKTIHLDSEYPVFEKSISVAQEIVSITFTMRWGRQSVTPARLSNPIQGQSSPRLSSRRSSRKSVKKHSRRFQRMKSTPQHMESKKDNMQSEKMSGYLKKDALGMIEFRILDSNDTIVKTISQQLFPPRWIQKHKVLFEEKHELIQILKPGRKLVLHISGSSLLITNFTIDFKFKSKAKATLKAAVSRTVKIEPFTSYDFIEEHRFPQIVLICAKFSQEVEECYHEAMQKYFDENEREGSKGDRIKTYSILRKYKTRTNLKDYATKILQLQPKTDDMMAIDHKGPFLMVINAKKDMEWIRYKDIAFCKYSGKQLDVKGILEFSKSYAKSPSRQMHYLDERSLGPRSALIYQENAASLTNKVRKMKMKTKSVPGKRKHVKTRKHKMSAPEGSDDEKHEGLKEQDSAHLVTVNRKRFETDILDSRGTRLLFVGCIRKSTLIPHLISEILEHLHNAMPSNTKLAKLHLTFNIPDKVTLQRSQQDNDSEESKRMRLSHDWRLEDFPAIVFYKNGEIDVDITTKLKTITLHLCKELYGAVDEDGSQQAPDFKSNVFMQGVERIVRILLEESNELSDNLISPIEHWFLGDVHLLILDEKFDLNKKSKDSSLISGNPRDARTYYPSGSDEMDDIKTQFERVAKWHKDSRKATLTGGMLSFSNYIIEGVEIKYKKFGLIIFGKNSSNRYSIRKEISNIERITSFRFIQGLRTKTYEVKASIPWTEEKGMTYKDYDFDLNMSKWKRRDPNPKFYFAEDPQDKTKKLLILMLKPLTQLGKATIPPGQGIWEFETIFAHICKWKIMCHVDIRLYPRLATPTLKSKAIYNNEFLWSSPMSYLETTTWLRASAGSCITGLKKRVENPSITAEKKNSDLYRNDDYNPIVKESKLPSWGERDRSHQKYTFHYMDLGEHPGLSESKLADLPKEENVFPVLILYEDVGNSKTVKYVCPAKGTDLTEEEIKRFIQAFQKGHLEPALKSQKALSVSKNPDGTYLAVNDDLLSKLRISTYSLVVGFYKSNKHSKERARQEMQMLRGILDNFPKTSKARDVGVIGIDLEENDINPYIFDYETDRLIHYVWCTKTEEGKIKTVDLTFLNKLTIDMKVNPTAEADNESFKHLAFNAASPMTQKLLICILETFFDESELAQRIRVEVSRRIAHQKIRFHDMLRPGVHPLEAMMSGRELELPTHLTIMPELFDDQKFRKPASLPDFSKKKKLNGDQKHRTLHLPDGFRIVGVAVGVSALSQEDLVPVIDEIQEIQNLTDWEKFGKLYYSNASSTTYDSKHANDGVQSPPVHQITQNEQNIELEFMPQSKESKSTRRKLLADQNNVDEKLPTFMQPKPTQPVKGRVTYTLCHIKSRNTTDFHRVQSFKNAKRAEKSLLKLENANDKTGFVIAIDKHVSGDGKVMWLHDSSKSRKDSVDWGEVVKKCCVANGIALKAPLGYGKGSQKTPMKIDLSKAIDTAEYSTLLVNTRDDEETPGKWLRFNALLENKNPIIANQSGGDTYGLFVEYRKRRKQRNIFDHFKEFKATISYEQIVDEKDSNVLKVRTAQIDIKDDYNFPSKEFWVVDGIVSGSLPLGECRHGRGESFVYHADGVGTQTSHKGLIATFQTDRKVSSIEISLLYLSRSPRLHLKLIKFQEAKFNDITWTLVTKDERIEGFSRFQRDIAMNHLGNNKESLEILEVSKTYPSENQRFRNGGEHNNELAWRRWPSRGESTKEIFKNVEEDYVYVKYKTNVWKSPNQVPLDFPVKTKLRGTLIIKFIWEAKMNQRGGYPNPEDWLFGGANEYNRYHLSQYIKIFTTKMEYVEKVKGTIGTISPLDSYIAILGTNMQLSKQPRTIKDRGGYKQNIVTKHFLPSDFCNAYPRRFTVMDKYLVANLTNQVKSKDLQIQLNILTIKFSSLHEPRTTEALHCLNKLAEDFAETKSGEGGKNQYFLVRFDEVMSFQVLRNSHLFKMKELKLTLRNMTLFSKLSGYGSRGIPGHYNWTKTSGGDSKGEDMRASINESDINTYSGIGNPADNRVILIYSSDITSQIYKKVVIEAARKEAMIENRDGISLKFIFVDLDNTDLPNNLWRVLSPGAMPPFLLYDENKTKIKRFEGEKLTPNSVLRFAGEDGRLEKDNDPEGLGPLHEFSPYHVLNSTQRRLRRRIVEYFFRDEWGVIFSKPIIEEMRQLLRSPKAHKAVLVATGKVDVDRSGNIEHEELGCCIFLMLSPVGMWAARRTYENSRTWKDYDAELGNRKEFKMSQIIAQVLEWYFSDRDIQQIIRRGEDYKFEHSPEELSKIIRALTYVILSEMLDGHAALFSNLYHTTTPIRSDKRVDRAELQQEVVRTNHLERRLEILGDRSSTAYDTPTISCGKMIARSVMVLASPIVVPFILILAILRGFFDFREDMECVFSFPMYGRNFLECLGNFCFHFDACIFWTGELCILVTNLITAGIFLAMIAIVAMFCYGNVVCVFIYTLMLSSDTNITPIEGLGPLTISYLMYIMMAKYMLRIWPDSDILQSFVQDEIHDFSEQRVADKIDFFHRGLVVMEREELKKQSNDQDVNVDLRKRKKKPEMITSLITKFKEDTKKMFEKIMKDPNHDAVTRLICNEDGFTREVVIPLVLALLFALLPCLIRFIRSEPAMGENSEEKFIASVWIITSVPFCTAMFVYLNNWIYNASQSLFSYYAISAVTSSFKSESVGLRFYIPLSNPDNLVGFMLLRKQLYKTIKGSLDKYVRMEVLLGPLVAVTLLIAAVIFVYVVQGQPLSVFNIAGFFVLVVLTVYVSAVLFIAAYGNLILNDYAVAMLASEKFSVSRKAWEASTTFQKSIKEFKIAQNTEEIRSNDNMVAMSNDLKSIRDEMEERGKDIRILQKSLSSVDTLCSMEMMLDSAIVRIKNKEDQGLYVKVFGLPVTFGTFATIGAVLSSAISAAASQLGRES